MIVRDIGINDIPVVAKLAIKTYKNAFGETMSEKELQKSLKSRDESYFRSVIDKDIIIIAQDDDQIIGFIQFGTVSYDSFPTSNKDMELKKIYIDKNYQGKGIGKKLMNAMLTHNRLNDIENIYLDVFAKNEEALGLYKKFGFQVIGKTPFKVDGKIIGHDLLMKRVLTQKTSSLPK